MSLIDMLGSAKDSEDTIIRATPMLGMFTNQGLACAPLMIGVSERTHFDRSPDHWKRCYKLSPKILDSLRLSENMAYNVHLIHHLAGILYNSTLRIRLSFFFFSSSSPFT